MPDGVAAKGAAKTKVDKPKNEKPKAGGGRVEKKTESIFTRFSRFIRESYIEVFKKASWPSWDELKKFTAVVIFAVLVVGFWIGGLDFIMTKVTHAIGLTVR